MNKTHEQILQDWEGQARERDARDPTRAQILEDAAILRAAIAATKEQTAAATERAVRAALEMAARLIYAENYDDPVSAGDAIRAIRDNSKAMAAIIEGAQDAKR